MNGLKYWDPEESTRTKWETTYASELQDRGLSQDFTGLSTLLLGQAQPAQFQTEGQTGYWWGSKVSDDGNWTTLNEVENNTNAELPRSYHIGNNSFGDSYTWYAATAESGRYNMSSYGNQIAADSMCPRGWKLPQNETNASKSWDNLIVTYDIGYGTGSSAYIRKPPILLLYSGNLYWKNGRYYLNGAGSFWSEKSVNIESANAYYLGFRDASVTTQGPNAKSYGFSVRCVKK